MADNADKPGVNAWKAAVIGLSSLASPHVVADTPSPNTSVAASVEKHEPLPGSAWDTDKDRGVLAQQALDSMKARGVEYKEVSEDISLPLHSNRGDPLKGGGDYRLLKMGEIIPAADNSKFGVGKEAWEKVINKIKNEPTAYERAVDSSYPKSQTPSMDSDQTFFGQANDLNDMPEFCGVIDIKHVDKKASVFDVNADNMVVFPKHLTEFLVQTHEMTHCAYQAPTLATETGEHFQALSKDYISSVNETAADLGANLYYASKTGTFNINKDLIQPMRLADKNDSSHSTAYALDVMLKDIDPKVVQGMDASQIPDLVIKTMQKNFEKDGKLINPHDPAQKGLTTPAMWAMSDEISSKGPNATASQQSRFSQKAEAALTHNHESFFQLLGFGDRAEMRLKSLPGVSKPTGDIPFLDTLLDTNERPKKDMQPYDMIDELRNPKRQRHIKDIGPSGPGM